MREATAPAAAMSERIPRFGVLLAAMVAELTLAPFIALVPGGLTMVRVLTALVLVAALWVAGARRTAVVLFAGALISHLVAGISTVSSVTAAAGALRLLFLSYVIALVVRHVLRDRAVTLDTVSGAACAYMLIGVVWADLFLLVELMRPGSFYVPAAWLTGPNQDLRSVLVYFSFATLTTLGYGDIHPTEPAAGSLCAAEALVGQLYLAIMIARMVGLHTSQRS